MNKRLLILGAGEMQVPVIRKANDMGLHTIVADMDANTPGMGTPRNRFLSARWIRKVFWNVPNVTLLTAYLLQVTRL